MNDELHANHLPTPVSILIVNYNGLHLLRTCLDSISRQTVRGFEVIVVDNGSRDGSVAWLSTCQYPWLKSVCLEENTGFGPANNRGFEASSGEIIVLLNNDTELPPDFLQMITEPFSNSDISMVAPLILYRSAPDIIDKAGGHRFYPDGLNRGRGCGQKLSGKWLNPGFAFYPDGCAAAFRRKLIQQCGFFDESFFLYGEDTDLGLRYRRMGAECRYEPAARVFHVHSATAGKYSPEKAYYVERNRYAVILRNLPLFWILVSPIFTLVRYFFQAISALTGKGSAGRFSGSHSRRQLLVTLYRANRDGIRSIPRLIRERRVLKRNFTVGGWRFSRLLIRYMLSPIELAFRE